MWIGNLMLLVINQPLIGIWADSVLHHVLSESCLAYAAAAMSAAPGVRQ